MLDNSEEIYEIGNTKSLRKISHSRLFGLEPIGIGTPYVESSTSYLARLADAHTISMDTLVRKELLPLVKLAKLSYGNQQNPNNLGANGWVHLARTLPSMNPMTKTWINIIEQLTLRSDLESLTMLNWKGIISSRGLIRREQAWCAQCFEEYLSAEGLIYRPLIWDLEVILGCTKHRCKLEMKCPNPECRRSFPTLSPHTHLGFCPYCYMWLGSQSENRLEVIDENNLQKQEWISMSVGELLANTQIWPQDLDNQNMRMLIKRYLDDKFIGNMSALARELHMNFASLQNMIKGEQIPQMSTLLKLCSTLKMMPLELITGYPRGSESQTATPPSITYFSRGVFRKPRKFDHSQIQNALNEILIKSVIPPPSMKKVADSLGYDQSHLYRHFPMQCRSISERYKNFLNSQAVARREKLNKEVEDAVRSLHNQGIYPSYGEIGKLLSLPDIKILKAREVRLAIMQELGYQLN